MSELTRNCSLAEDLILEIRNSGELDKGTYELALAVTIQLEALYYRLTELDEQLEK